MSNGKVGQSNTSDKEKKIEVKIPQFVSGEWKDRRGEDIPDKATYGERVNIQIKTQHISNGTEVKIKIREKDFLFDDDITELISKVQQDKVNIEFLLLPKWYTGERDQLDELYFEVSSEVKGQKIKRKFSKNNTINVQSLFDALWENYPVNKDGNSQPCIKPNGMPAFQNQGQCAICMGIALEKARIDTSNFTGARCWYGHKEGDNVGQVGAHILRCEELADWLADNGKIFGQVQKRSNVRTSDYKGKQGIICFKDFWQRPEQTVVEGDHVDLWNRDKMANGNLDYFEKSEEVWFWEL